MLEYTFRDKRPPSLFAGEKKNLKSVKLNPVAALPETENAMTSYLSRLKVNLLETGYSDSQVRLLQTAAGPGRYLEWHKIGLSEAGVAELEAYSTDCGRSPSGKRTNYNTGLSTIQSVPRSDGILCRQNRLSY